MHAVCDTDTDSDTDTCTPCGVGYFSNATKTIEFTECPEDMTTYGKGATNCTFVSCAPGYSRTVSAMGICEVCPAGKSSSSGESCTRYELGYFAASEGGITCVHYAKGSYADETNSVTCKKCGMMIALCLCGPLSSATFFERVMEGSTSLRKGINEKFARENIPLSVCS